MSLSQAKVSSPYGDLHTHDPSVPGCWFGETVSVARFASFSAPWRVVRTGGSIEIPQVKVPVFKPGKALKNAERRAPDLVAVRPPAVH